MKKVVLLALLPLILPQFAFAQSMDFTQIATFSPIILMLVVVALLSLKLFDHFSGRSSIVNTRKYLVPLLTFYSIYSLIIINAGGPICDTAICGTVGGKEIFLDSLRIYGLPLAIIGLAILAFTFWSQNRKSNEKFVAGIAMGVLCFILLQFAVECWVMIPEEVIVVPPPAFLPPTT